MGTHDKKLMFLKVENPELPKVEIEIPSQLKLKLEDDCYFIKRKKKVITTENFNGYFYHLKIKYKVKIIYDFEACSLSHTDSHSL